MDLPREGRAGRSRVLVALNRAGLGGGGAAGAAGGAVSTMGRRWFLGEPGGWLTYLCWPLLAI